MSTFKPYVVGIDVGRNSVGFAAVGVDVDGAPTELKSAVVLIHDAGVDPDNAKQGHSRLAVSGVARRTRRMFRRRRRRLKDLDRFLAAEGYPVVNVAQTYDVWKARARLATEFIEDEKERKHLISLAVRHIARHRGWRNPWLRVESLLEPAEPSDQFREVMSRVEHSFGRPMDGEFTVGQLVAASAMSADVHLRQTKAATSKGEIALLGVRLMQSDYANELRQIASVQRLGGAFRDALIRRVFRSESPRGAAARRVGSDPLPGQGSRARASKAIEAFQRYRIVSILANLRVKDGNDRVLSVKERRRAYEFLANVEPTSEPTWTDVADEIGVERSRLEGTASATADGDRASARPPVNVTDRVIRLCKVEPLANWWPNASEVSREALTRTLTSGIEAEDSAADIEASRLLREMDDGELGRLDSLNLPAGRAAYSIDSLQRLAEFMLDNEADLHAARKELFGVGDDWEPPADPIGAPVGNPAVDRVLKAVSRYLSAITAEFGCPRAVVIEHVRDGMISEAAARDVDRANNRRHERNRAAFEKLRERAGTSGEYRRSDLIRFQAIFRQNCQCLYCGTAITYASAEMDHIVPRAGVGSTNHRENLAAVCGPCNRSKSDRPFATWAEESQRPGVSLDDALERTRHWLRQDGVTVREHNSFVHDVQMRLKRTEADHELDGRTMESTAWMSNELATRIRQHYKRRPGEFVSVYRGAITAEARKASGIEKQIPFIGGGGKTRLDRRHHAVDAAVVAVMNPSVARTIAERIDLRGEQRLTRANVTWQDHEGSTHGAKTRFRQWREHMADLLALLAEALERDRIPVAENLRLRLGNGAAHKDTIQALIRHAVGDELSSEIIDRASMPALWKALTSVPDFDQVKGLPASSTRQIRVHGLRLGADDEIGFFGSGAAAIAVRDGYAEIGDTIHHARVYRIGGGRKPVYGILRVFAVDLRRHRDRDLFTAPIPPESISMRTAEPKVRDALTRGTASYLGWLVTGDELVLDMSHFKTGKVGDLLSVYPGTTRWRLTGFDQPTKLTLRPAMLAAEGLPEDAHPSVVKILEKGWIVATNQACSGGMQVIRRDALGRPRVQSSAHLPTCWTIEA